MSHITDVKLRMRELEDIETAGRECGLELMRGQTRYATYDGMMPCAHALRPVGTKGATGYKGSYEIGLIAAPDGDGFDVKYDVFGVGSKVTALVENDANKLRREYAAAVAMRKAKANPKLRGFVATRTDEGSRIRVRLVKR